MPNLIHLKRTASQSQIDFNPVEITFSRETKILNNISGSLETIKSTYTETIRITKQNNTTAQLTQDLGLSFNKSGYVLLGNYSSNMKCNKDVTDFFIHNNEYYKITSVMINYEKSQITSVQAIAEVVESWQT